MMNIFALSLVFSTLLTASVHSPNPLRSQDVIVKEGHRVVMVEYDEEGAGNTKVSISQGDQGSSGIVKSVTDTISGLSGVIGGGNGKEKGNVDIAKGVASKSKSMFWGAAESAKDTVTSKAKLASSLGFGGAKGAAEATKQGIKETEEMARRGKVAVGDAMGKSKTWKGYIMRILAPKKVSVLGRIGIFFVGLWHAVLGSMRLYIDVMELFGFAIAYGVSIWVTFLSSYMLADALPRQQFANVQSKTFPLYFTTMAYSVGLVFLGHLLSLLLEGKIKKFAALGNFPGWNLLLSLGLILANWLYYEPQLSKVVLEKLKFEKEEGSDTPGAVNRSPRSTESTVTSPTRTETSATVPPMAESEASEASRSKIIELSAASKKLHCLSSNLNMLSLMGLTFHLVYLAQRLGPTY